MVWKWTTVIPNSYLIIAQLFQLARVKLLLIQRAVPPVGTVSFIVLCEGRLLVERRRLNARTDPGIVAIPGGHIQRGESLVEAVRRELREETGLDCDSFTLIARKCHSTPLESQTVYTFRDSVSRETETGSLSANLYCTLGTLLRERKNSKIL